MIDILRDGDLTIITLNRPDKANALTRDMLDAVAEAAKDARTVSKALILTGRGNTFSAGMDLFEAEGGLATSPAWEQASGAIAAFPGLSIAALNGTAAGGSLGMVLATDLRVSVPAAKLFYPVMKLGFRPQPSDPVRLVRLVGPARAKRILMAGERITAGEAASWGLVDHIADDPLEVAKGLAADVLQANAGHVSVIKRMIDHP